MKLIKGFVSDRAHHDDKVAQHLRRLLLKVYKYSVKYGLWEVRMLVTNKSAIAEHCLRDIVCYAEVSAWRYDAKVVSDATSLPIIEELV